MERASPLRGQVAIVTGAGRGVGRAIAEALADSGAAVALAARSEVEVVAAAAAIEEAGGCALAHPADVTDERAVSDLVAQVAACLGPPALLVNAAGAWTQVGPVEGVDPEAWWRDVEVTLRGTFLCSRAVIPSMASLGRGRIVNVASQAAVVARPYATAYASAKAAVLRFTDSLAGELDGRGVHAFAISPGFVRTRLIEELAASEAGSQVSAPAHNPRRRPGAGASRSARCRDRDGPARPACGPLPARARRRRRPTSAVDRDR